MAGVPAFSRMSCDGFGRTASSSRAGLRTTTHLLRALLAVARDHLAREIAPTEYEAQLHYPGAPESLDAPGGHTARRLLQAYARDAVFREWATSPLARAAAAPAARPRTFALAQAHHNCVMTKQPRYSSVTGWHQDIRYWSFERPELVSVWLALGREHPDNGCLSLLPGSHCLELRARAAGRGAVPARGPAGQPGADRQARVTPLLEPGDVVFFHCRMFHAAGANRTRRHQVLAGVHATTRPTIGRCPAAARRRAFGRACTRQLARAR